MFAFRGDAGGSTIEWTYFDPSRDRYRAMLFYGCDFGKALGDGRTGARDPG